METIPICFDNLDKWIEIKNSPQWLEYEGKKILILNHTETNDLTGKTAECLVFKKKQSSVKVRWRSSIYTVIEATNVVEKRIEERRLSDLIKEIDPTLTGRPKLHEDGEVSSIMLPKRVWIRLGKLAKIAGVSRNRYISKILERETEQSE